MSQGSKMGAPMRREEASPTIGSAGAAPHARRSWGCAAVAIVAIVVGGFLCWFIISQFVRGAGAVPAEIRKIAEVMQPKVIINQEVISAVADVRRQNKLVVLNATVNADVTRQEGGSSWGIYWGTNTARVRVRDAKVQYYIDLANMGTSNFVYDESSKTLTVTVPRPKLDTQMVSIDPGKIETVDLSGGWARWDKRGTWEHAVAELVPQVIVEASMPLVRKEADASGKDAMIGLLRPMADTLGRDGVQVEIRYAD